MNYDSAFLEKVKAFGILGYPAHEIVFLVEPDNVDQFNIDFDNPESDIYQAYHKGAMTGTYTLDKALFDKAKNNDADANEKLNQRQHLKRVDTAIHQRFHI